MAGHSERIARTAALPDDVEQAYYVVTNAAGGVASYLFSTEKLAPGVQGYGGPMALALMLDAYGALADFRIVKSRETPAYLELLAPWMESLKGKQLFVADALMDVDTVTGATLSSAAIKQSLATAGNAFAREVLGVGPAAGTTVRTQRRPDVRFFAVVVLTAVALALRTRPHRRVRQAFLVLVLIVFGILLNTQYSLSQALCLLGLQLPPAGINWVFLLVVAMPLFVLLFGNVYCGYLCPFGALQELIGHLRPAGLRTSPGKSTWRYGRLVKYLLLFAVVSLFAMGLDHAISSADPLVGVFSSRRSAAVAAFAGAALCLSFPFPRFWCRNLCPAGAFLALLSGARLLGRLLPGVNHKLCPFGVTANADLDCICCDRCRVPTPREHEALKEAAAVRDGRRSYVFLASVLLLAVLLMTRIVATRQDAATVAGASAAPAGGAQPRDVDMPALRHLIDTHRLSGREAMYYRRVVPPNETGAEPGKDGEPTR